MSICYAEDVLRAKKDFYKYFKKNKIIMKERNQCECGSLDFITLQKEDRFGFPVNMKICKNCGLIITTPFISEGVEFFYEKLYHKLHFGREIKTHSLVEDEIPKNIYLRVKKFFKGKIKINILELGAAAGNNLIEIKDYFKSEGKKIYLYGTEFNKDYRKIGEARGIKYFDFIVDSEIINVSFDLIILSHVLEHFNDLGTSLKKIRALLKDDGVLYVGVPGLFSINTMMRYNFELKEYFTIAHNYHFVKETLKILMKKYGFKMVYGNEEIEAVFVKGEKREIKRNNIYKKILLYLEKLKKGDENLKDSLKKISKFRSKVKAINYFINKEEYLKALELSLNFYKRSPLTDKEVFFLKYVDLVRKVRRENFIDQYSNKIVIRNNLFKKFIKMVEWKKYEYAINLLNEKLFNKSFLSQLTRSERENLFFKYATAIENVYGSNKAKEYYYYSLLMIIKEEGFYYDYKKAFYLYKLSKKDLARKFLKKITISKIEKKLSLPKDITEWPDELKTLLSDKYKLFYLITKNKKFLKKAIAYRKLKNNKNFNDFEFVFNSFLKLKDIQNAKVVYNIMERRYSKYENGEIGKKIRIFYLQISPLCNNKKLVISLRFNKNYESVLFRYIKLITKELCSKGEENLLRKIILDYENSALDKSKLIVKISRMLERTEVSQLIKEFFLKREFIILQKKERKSYIQKYRIASILKKLRKYNDSKFWFKKVIKIQSNNELRAGAYFHLGEIELTMGNRIKAERLLKKCVNLNPEHKKAKEYLKQLHNKDV